MTADSGTRLRADARRNRDQIIAAAKTIFAEAGPDAPMEEIARRAGVGVGTLYRRFPDRDALIRAVGQDNFTQLLAAARAARAEESSPWQVLLRLVRQARELQLGFQLGMRSPHAAAILRADPETQRLRRETLDMLDELVQDAQDEGTLRPDIGAGDLTLMFAMLFHGVRGPATMSASVVSERMLMLMLDGLRTRSGTPLPGRPIGSDDLDYR